MKLTPVVFDGAIYVSLALFTFLQTQLGGDKAAKYIAPVLLFWCKLVIGSFAACALAIKMYRSTSYADSVAEAKNGHTSATATDVSANVK
jgi:hypothetical protein